MSPPPTTESACPSRRGRRVAVEEVWPGWSRLERRRTTNRGAHTVQRRQSATASVGWRALQNWTAVLTILQEILFHESCLPISREHMPMTHSHATRSALCQRRTRVDELACMPSCRTPWSQRRLWLLFERYWPWCASGWAVCGLRSVYLPAGGQMSEHFRRNVAEMAVRARYRRFGRRDLFISLWCLKSAEGSLPATVRARFRCSAATRGTGPVTWVPCL